MINCDPRRKFATLRQRYGKIQTLPNTTTASTGVCLAAEWPEPLHECLQLQGNQIRSKTELPDLCRCGRACARSAAHEILGERQRRWWGLFWWRGSINIALPPPRLLVCLAAVTRTLQCSGDGTRGLMAVSAQLQQRKLSFFSHSFRRVGSDVEGQFVMKSTQ